MLQGLRTVGYPVTDTTKAKEFYTALTGVEPYFDQSFYIGYNVCGYELGLQPRESVPAWAGGAVTYWGVANIEEGMKHALAVGGKPHQEIQDVGDGIRVSSVLDPFGNVVGLIENPHFKLPE